MNMHELAVKVCEIEGGKKQVNIADVKEIMRIIDDLTDGSIKKWCDEK